MKLSAMLPGLRIRTQLAASFGLLLLLMLTLSVVALSQLNSLHDRMERIVRGVGAHAHAADSFDRLLLAQRGIALVNENARRAFELFLLSSQGLTNSEKFSRTVADQQQTTRDITEVYRQFESTLTTASEKSDFDAIKTARTDYVSTRTRVEKTLAEGRVAQATEGLHQEVLPKLAVYLNAWRSLMELEKTLATAAERDVTREYLRAKNFMLALLGFSIILSFGLAYAVTRQITSSLARLSNAATRLAAGDLTARVAVGSRDEIGHLSEAFNGMADKLDRSHRRARIYAEVVGSTADGVVIATADRVVVDANAAYLKMTGYSHEEVVGSTLLEHATQASTTQPEPHWLEVLQRQQVWRGELRLGRKLGGAVPCIASVTAVQDEDGGVRHLVGICHDISELRQHQVRLEHQATHDALTGLPNRTLLLERIGWSISRCARDGRRLAIMFIDLDKFKEINDTLGHSAGDELLIATAERLARCVRNADTVARLGGDEFVVLADQIDDEQTVSRLAQRIVTALAEPVRLAGEEHVLTCSVGICAYPEDGNDAELLMKHADIAMYRAKEAGRNNFQFYKPAMQARVGERLTLERKLHRALERGEFLLHFQPQVDLRSGGITGAEALIRWQSPEFGLVPPARFIPLAEESGLIVAIGEWVLSTACRTVAEWQRDGVPAVPIAINVAASQFAGQRIDSLVETSLRSAGIEPRYLDLELTESLSMADPEASIPRMHHLKDIGVSLSIDDFGTGYSNLAYLKRFPIDTLKIDQSFVRNMAMRPEERAIAVAVVSLAHALGIRALAEGVETEGQLKLLAEAGCDAIQGYYFSRPLPERDIRDLLSSKKSLDMTRLKRSPYRRTVLLVDDDLDTHWLVRNTVESEELELLCAESTEQAYDLLAGHEVGVVVADYRLPGENGIEFLARVRKLRPRAVRILFTGDTGAEVYATAINRGEVFRFMPKPWKKAQMLEVLREAFARYERADAEASSRTAS